MFSDKDILRVRSFTWFAEHSSVEAAIEDAWQQRMDMDPIALNKNIVGARIEAVEFSDTACAFCLDDSRAIGIAISATGVKWSIGKSAEIAIPARQSAPSCLMLQYPSESGPHVWDRAESLRCRTNREFVSIVELDHQIFLYVKNCPPLLFGGLLVDNINPPTRLLSWDDAI